jgi:hypothetical protein
MVGRQLQEPQRQTSGRAATGVISYPQLRNTLSGIIARCRQVAHSTPRETPRLSSIPSFSRPNQALPSSITIPTLLPPAVSPWFRAAKIGLPVSKGCQQERDSGPPADPGGFPSPKDRQQLEFSPHLWQSVLECIGWFWSVCDSRHKHLVCMIERAFFVRGVIRRSPALRSATNCPFALFHVVSVRGTAAAATVDFDKRASTLLPFSKQKSGDVS